MVWLAHVACTLIPLMYQRNLLNQFSRLKLTKRIYLALVPLLPWFHHKLPSFQGRSLFSIPCSSCSLTYSVTGCWTKSNIYTVPIEHWQVSLLGQYSCFSLYLCTCWHNHLVHTGYPLGMPLGSAVSCMRQLLFYVKNSAARHLTYVYHVLACFRHRCSRRGLLPEPPSRVSVTSWLYIRI
jgi:hypothetical protein